MTRREEIKAIKEAYQADLAAETNPETRNEIVIIINGLFDIMEGIK